MRSSLGGKRQARKIGQEEDEEDSGDARSRLGSQERGRQYTFPSAKQSSDM